jgi:hypothetical protein
LLLSLCSAVDIDLLYLLRGNRVALRRCDPIVFPRYFQSSKLVRDEQNLRQLIDEIIEKQPNIRLIELADRIGVESSILYRKLPDVVQRLRENRLQQRAFERWKVHMQFARKLLLAKRQLDRAGRRFTTFSVFQCVKVIARSDAQIRLFHFVRNYF